MTPDGTERRSPAGPLLALLLAFTPTACSDGGITGIGADAFDTSPTQVQFDGVSYILDPFVWRDFSEKEYWTVGSPLFVSSVLYAVGKPEVPQVCEPGEPQHSCRWPLEVVETHVRNRETGEIWSTKQLDSMGVFLGEDSNGLEYIAHDGPRWEPFILVDVLVKVRSAAGKKALLRADAPDGIHRYLGDWFQ